MKHTQKITNIHGLKDRIRMAETLAEIDALLTEGETYDDASPATRHMWKRKAKYRRQQLGNGHSASTTE